MSPSRSMRVRTRALLPCAVITAATALLAGTAGTAVAAPSTPAAASDHTMAHVIVLGKDGALATVTRAVNAHGGTVTRELPIVNGVAADVPASAEALLRATAGVVAVTPDAHGHLLSVDPALGYDQMNDDGSMTLAEDTIGARKVWSRGYTGKGVDIALIDSGVSPVPGLTSGNVVNGPDLSFDSQNPALANLDGYGHGTHMASIMVGRDAVDTPKNYSNATGTFLGVAPDARLVSVKVAAADGSADVSQVIAAINWVDQNAHSNGLNIRVLNLSYGTNSTQDYTVDPLAYAVEQAWKHGIVVVCSGGNDGQSQYTLADPAYDPTVIAVGADEPNGTANSNDDTVAPFTTRGTNTRHVDVVAPGVHVLGLRDPGSVVDQNNPSAVVGGRFFRGSGTSQAAAMTSGAAALLIQKYPNASPDQIKKQITLSADPMPSIPDIYRGAGVLDMSNAIAGAISPAGQPAGTPSTGSGTLDAARGGSYVADPDGNVLTGEIDIFGDAWQPATWASAVASKTSWGKDGSWNGAVWIGSGFTPNSYGIATWQSSCWRSTSWRGLDWTSTSWRSSVWRDGSWQSTDWLSTSWRSSVWRDVTWADATWS